MANRAQDWLAQAEHDLAHAERSARGGDHAWACFAAQQAGEHAVKALHLSLGQEAWGHVVADLLTGLGVELPGDLLDLARDLDALYIPTRYANGHAAGAPFRHYGEMQSKRALDAARRVLSFVQAHMGCVDADNAGSEAE